MRKFKKVYIEITNICNLSCNFCPKTKRKYKFMNREEFNYILIKIIGTHKHLFLISSII